MHTTYLRQRGGRITIGIIAISVLFFIGAGIAKAASPVVQTKPATDVSINDATLNGFVNGVGRSETERWFEWGEVYSYNNKTSKVLHGSGSGSFSVRISNLKPGTGYSFVLKADNEDGLTIGKALVFYTPSLAPRPIVTTIGASDITKSSVRLRGSVNANGSTETERWFEWGPTQQLGRTTSRRSHGLGSSSYDETLSGLAEGTKYFYRAIAENESGARFGITGSFITAGVGPDNLGGGGSSSSGGSSGSGSSGGSSDGGYYDTSGSGRPIISTNPATSVTSFSGTLNGYVDPRGTADTIRWFEWGASPTLDRTTGIISHGSLQSNFSHALTELNPDATYFYRANAQNSLGLSRGAILSFRTGVGGGVVITPPPPTTSVPPVVTTQAASSVTTTGMTLNALVVNEEILPIKTWFEWGITSSLGRETFQKDQGSIRSINFNDVLIGLQPNTTYYYRGVAQSPHWTSRGRTLTIRTGGVFVAPPVTISPPVTSLSPPTPPPSIGTRVAEITKHVSNESFPNCLADNCIIAIGGNTIEYTITVENDGTLPLRNVSITDELSPALTFVSTSDDGDYSSVLHSIVWTIDELAPDAIETVSILLRAKDVDRDVVVKNIATIDADNLSLRSNVTEVHIFTVNGSDVIDLDDNDSTDESAFVGGVTRSTSSLLLGGLLLLILALLVIMLTFNVFSRLRRRRARVVATPTDTITEEQI